MKQGWEYKKLGEIGNIVTGSTPSTKDESNYSPREYCFVKPSDLPSQGIVLIEETEYYVSRKGLSKSRVLPTGSVLVSCIGSIGKIGILTKEACSNQQINAIIPKNDIDSKFIAYSIYAYRFLLESIANAPVVPIINKTDFSKIQIPLPPKSTQLSIVSELDKINELIRLKKEQLKDYDNLAQSIFYEMFGDPVENEKEWEVKKIGDLAIVKTGPFGSMLHKEDYITDGIPLVNPIHMKNFKIVPDMEFTISKEKACELENYMLQNNDVVFARRGDIGRCAIVSEIEKGYLCGTGSLFVRFTEDIESVFIMYIIRSESFSKHLVSKAKGATMLNINSNTIADLEIPLPPLPLQHLFAQRIEQIERQKSAVQKSITDLETLLASRMQYWFE